MNKQLFHRRLSDPGATVLDFAAAPVDLVIALSGHVLGEVISGVIWCVPNSVNFLCRARDEDETWLVTCCTPCARSLAKSIESRSMTIDLSAGSHCLPGLGRPGR
jgi:hypothetical protein